MMNQGHEEILYTYSYELHVYIRARERYKIEFRDGQYVLETAYIYRMVRLSDNDRERRSVGESG